MGENNARYLPSKKGILSSINGADGSAKSPLLTKERATTSRGRFKFMMLTHQLDFGS